MLLVASFNCSTHRTRLCLSALIQFFFFVFVLNLFGCSFGIKGDINGWHDGSLDGVVLLELLFIVGEVL